MSAYTDRVEANLQGLHAVSTGACPGCPECMDRDGFTDKHEHKIAWRNCRLIEEPHFSWCSCDICGSRLGGNRYRWHALDHNDEILHFEYACTDCVMFLANGDEPEERTDG